MSSSNKSKTTVSFSASDVPKFDGRNYLQWKERITGVLLYSDVMDIMKGNLVEPDEDDVPNPPDKPAANANSATVAIAAYNFTKYQHELQQHRRRSRSMPRRTLRPWASFHSASASPFGIRSRTSLPRRHGIFYKHILKVLVI